MNTILIKVRLVTTEQQLFSSKQIHFILNTNSKKMKDQYCLKFCYLLICIWYSRACTRSEDFRKRTEYKEGKC